MKTRFVWIGLAAALAAACIGAGQAEPSLPAIPGRLTEEATQDWARIVDRPSGCVLVNNTWNKGAAPPDFEQSVFREEMDGAALAGWRWYAPGLRGTVVSMPEIVCGDKPWDEPLRLRRDFPFRAGEKRLTVDFDIDLHATGRYNMAFTLWAVSALPVSRRTITHEIMIWNVDSNHQRAGSQIGSVTAGGTTWDVFVEPGHQDNSGAVTFTWTYVAFIAEKPILNGSLDFGVFIDYLLARKLLTRDHYLTSIELGDEVTSGSGSVELRHFSLGMRDAGNNGRP